jgi:hypothetical protein
MCSSQQVTYFQIRVSITCIRLFINTQRKSLGRKLRDGHVHTFVYKHQYTEGVPRPKIESAGPVTAGTGRAKRTTAAMPSALECEHCLEYKSRFSGCIGVPSALACTHCLEYRYRKLS